MAAKDLNIFRNFTRRELFSPSPFISPEARILKGEIQNTDPGKNAGTR